MNDISTKQLKAKRQQLMDKIDALNQVAEFHKTFTEIAFEILL